MSKRFGNATVMSVHFRRHFSSILLLFVLAFVTPAAAQGIGTINVNDPNNRLFVETGIRTRKVTVDQATWPDYVFSQGYRLMPLDSLNRFIVTHHHLPEMPSADSVAKNGVELGDAQSKLLKKVEELTLYVLQQQKELEEVKAENKRLAEEMAARLER